MHQISLITDHEAADKSICLEKSLSDVGFLSISFQHTYFEAIEVAESYQQWIIDSGTYIPEFDSTEKNRSPFVSIMAMLFYKRKNMIFELCSELIAKNIGFEAIYDQIAFALKHIDGLINEGAL